MTLIITCIELLLSIKHTLMVYVKSGKYTRIASAFSSFLINLSMKRWSRVPDLLGAPQVFRYPVTVQFLPVTGHKISKRVPAYVTFLLFL